MQKVIRYLERVLADHNGEASTKRVVTLIFSILIGVGYCANLFYGLQISDNILDAVMFVVVAGFGFTGVEKFALAKNNQDGAE